MTIAHEYADSIMAQRLPEQPIYLLLDPLKSIWGHYLISIPTLKEKLTDARIAVVPRPDLLHEPENSPHLVLLAKAGEALTEEALHILRYSINYALNEHPGSRRYVCGWLQSPLGLEEQANDLAERMYFKKENTNTSASMTIHPEGSPRTPSNTNIYPIYEPLRQELLGVASYHDTVDAHSTWLLPISTWILPTANKELMQFTGKQQEGTNGQLSRNSMQAEADAPIVSDIISVWYRYTQEKLTQAQRQQLPLLQHWQNAIAKGAAYQAVLYVRLARRKGLRNRQDQITFAIMRFLSHPKFDEHPAIQKLVTQAAQEEGQYGELLGQIPHPQWMKILAELNDGSYLNYRSS